METNDIGDEYRFVKVDDFTYTIEGTLKWWRFGAKEGTGLPNPNDLGYVHPEGGPYIAVGSEIEGRKIVSIRAFNEMIYFRVEE